MKPNPPQSSINLIPSSKPRDVRRDVQLNYDGNLPHSLSVRVGYVTPWIGSRFIPKLKTNTVSYSTDCHDFFARLWNVKTVERAAPTPNSSTLTSERWSLLGRHQQTLSPRCRSLHMAQSILFVVDQCRIPLSRMRSPS